MPILADSLKTLAATPPPRITGCQKLQAAHKRIVELEIRLGLPLSNFVTEM